MKIVILKLDTGKGLQEKTKQKRFPDTETNGIYLVGIRHVVTMCKMHTSNKIASNMFPIHKCLSRRKSLKAKFKFLNLNMKQGCTKIVGEEG